jgi:radical SAM-linked protein
VISNVGTRLRLRYCKLGKVRFVSHRDGARLWERALRRVDLPVAATEGFTPRPKLGFGLALPTGAESVAEYLDVDLHRSATVGASDPDWTASTAAAISAALPRGIDVTVLAEREPGSASLQELVSTTSWELTWPGVDPAHRGVDADSLESAAQRVLAADELLVERERKGRRRLDDVRPLIRDLRVRCASDGVRGVLVADLTADGSTLRPAELAELVVDGVDGVDARVLRTHQWVDDDAGRREVLPGPDLVGASREVSA